MQANRGMAGSPLVPLFLKFGREVEKNQNFSKRLNKPIPYIVIILFLSNRNLLYNRLC